MKKEKSTIAAVVFHVHINTPHRHIAKLFIKNVPEHVTKSEIKEMVTAAGYVFQEFEIPWANHYVQRDIKDGESQVIGAYKRGDVETIEYVSLVANSIL